MSSQNSEQRRALHFVLLFGVISLLADVTYQGARSITGPFLAILGASAAVVGVVSGLGELIGYSLRMLFGYWTDRTQQYWAIILGGYLINLLAVPLLAFTYHWWWAVVLILLERLGKAMRIPARDAMLSHAGEQIGMGWGFGLHEALDRVGAMLGPLMIAMVLYYRSDDPYRMGFAFLAIPALIAWSTLWVAKKRYPKPSDLSQSVRNHVLDTRGIPGVFKWYLMGALLVAAGFADFPLIAYHFQKNQLLSPVWIPLAYAIAMGVDGFMSLVLGRLYDRCGFWLLILVTAVSAFFAPLVFLGGSTLALLGVLLWAVGVGSHQSLMRAIVGKMVGEKKRASAYGIFGMGYGIAWFIGSALMGVIYDVSITGVVIFIVALQLMSLPVFLFVWRRFSK